MKNSMFEKNKSAVTFLFITLLLLGTFQYFTSFSTPMERVTSSDLPYPSVFDSKSSLSALYFESGPTASDVEFTQEIPFKYQDIKDGKIAVSPLPSDLTATAQGLALITFYLKLKPLEQFVLKITKKAPHKEAIETETQKLKTSFKSEGIRVKATPSPVPSPSPISSAIKLSKCTSITESGYYELSSDIPLSSTDCMKIAANDVTLDCKNFEIKNSFDKDDRGSKTGILIKASENVVVKNCKITGFTLGILSSTSKNIRLTENIIKPADFNFPLVSYRGIFLTEGTTDSTVEKNIVLAPDKVVYSSSFGIDLLNSKRITVSENTVQGRKTNRFYPGIGVAFSQALKILKNKVLDAHVAYGVFSSTEVTFDDNQASFYNKGLFVVESSGSFNRNVLRLVDGAGKEVYGIETDLSKVKPVFQDNVVCGSLYSLICTGSVRPVMQGTTCDGIAGVCGLKCNSGCSEYLKAV